MNRIFTACCFCLICLYASAQEARIMLIGIEAGADGIVGQMPDHDYIRAEPSYYGDASKDLRGFTAKSYAGFKIETRSLSNKFGLSAGLRFTRINSSLGKPDYWSSYSNSNFFYFMIKQTDTSIEYLKVKEINEASNYLGIPLAISWYPFNQHLFTFYFKSGIEFSYRLNTKTTVDFVDNGMNQYNDAVVGRLGTTNDLISILSARGGVKIGRGQKVGCTIEVGPSVFLNKRTTSITGASGGFGAQINLHMAL